MQNSIISEGKTTNEAIENGLKKLGVTKKDVEIKVLEEEKKSFFDILAPRIVKVELILKEGKKDHREVKVGEKDIEEAVNKTKDFLNDLKKELGNIEYAIEIKEDIIYYMGNFYTFQFENRPLAIHDQKRQSPFLDHLKEER